MYVRDGRPAFARPYVRVHRSTSFMSSSLLLQQCCSKMSISLLSLSVGQDALDIIGLNLRPQEFRISMNSDFCISTAFFISPTKPNHIYLIYMNIEVLALNNLQWLIWSCPWCNGYRRRKWTKRNPGRD